MRWARKVPAIGRGFLWESQKRKTTMETYTSTCGWDHNIEVDIGEIA
jgi:hypothetical protein